MYLDFVHFSSSLYGYHKVPELGLVSILAVQVMKKNLLLV